MTERQSIASREIGLEQLDLTDRRLDEVLTATGNHEGKAALLLAMQPGEDYDPGELYDLTVRTAGSPDIYVGSGRLPQRYCDLSLNNGNLVDKIQGSPPAYRITPDGEDYGKAMAGAMLELGDKHDLPLESLFSSSATTGNVTAPAARRRLARVLVDNEARLKISQVADKAGVSRLVASANLRSLALEGLVGLDNPDIENEPVAYRWVGGKPMRARQRLPLTVAALDYLSETPRAVTLDEIMEVCWERLDDETKRATTLADARPRLNRTLNQVCQSGRVERQGRDGNNSSAVWLEDTQRQLWDELLTVLAGLKSAGTRQDWRERGQDLLDDTNKMARLYTRGYERSPRAQNGSAKTLGELALSVLADHGRALSLRETIQVIKRDHGRRVSLNGLVVAAQNLEASGAIEEAPRKRGVQRFRAA